MKLQEFLLLNKKQILFFPIEKGTYKNMFPFLFHRYLKCLLFHFFIKTIQSMNCLIIDELHPNIENLLLNIGIKADYQPAISAQKVAEIIGNYDGLILRSKIKLDKPLLEKGEKLRFIARAGAGLDTIDEAFLKEKNITLLNAPEGNRDAVGEHTIGLLLALMNNFQKGDKEVRQKNWLREANRGEEIGTKTVGIIGYGNMGQAFAKRLQGFGTSVIAYDKFRTNYGDAFAKETNLETIFAQADIVSFHIPLTPENRHVANESFFQKFNKNIYFINTARGEISTFKAIRNGLETGKIKGAALDVLENEKLQTLNTQQEANFNYLATSEKVIFSPHVAGWTVESLQKINEVLVQKIKQLFEGK